MHAQHKDTSDLVSSSARICLGFRQFLLGTNGVFILHEETRVPLSTYIDDCATGVGAVLSDEAYHTLFLAHVLAANRPICHLKALNAMHGHHHHLGSKAKWQIGTSVL